MDRLPYLAGALLLAATSFASAQSALPDPVAPAVIGRPLDQIRPARPQRARPALAKPHGPLPVVAANTIVHTPPAATVAVAPAVVQEAPAPASAPVVAQAVRKTLVPGSYFDSRDQAMVRSFYAGHPVSGGAAKWKIGEPLPPDAVLTGVPDDVRAALPAAPPGLQYVQADDEVVLVAMQSRVVVDGIRRGARPAGEPPGMFHQLQQFARYFARD